MPAGRATKICRWKGSVEVTELGQRFVVDRHVAPAKHGHSFFGKRFGHNRLAPGAARGVLRHENLANGVFAGRGQLESEALRFSGKKFMRDLNENARPVAGERIGADGASMLQMEQDFQRILHNLMTFHALDVRDQAEATGIVFVGRMIKPLRFGEAVGVVQPVTWMHRGFGHGCIFRANSLCDRRSWCSSCVRASSRVGRSARCSGVMCSFGGVGCFAIMSHAVEAALSNFITLGTRARKTPPRNAFASLKQTVTGPSLTAWAFQPIASKPARIPG